ncbi:Membrane-bound metal-dependent hydrolase YbcI, DUF457 family [Raineyella antarctica]|uniref:Membrane-bound metal-dependent hydrolase YbcI, DUF457 family n=1 Tax=Raineyella antarctica TaxID=1577474 RepID=A0A1G6HH48_9ACTN|nr:metal-dependent hydrolase [Raineyella antarctica]SDB93570.1 Membrane-bound metal-dependent hydrolase YbcI, DUF457 family [Raineyella antarctica]
MLGRTHATSGVALALAAVPALTGLGVLGNAWSIPLVAAAAAGGAMMPDFDHPSATIARSLGPISKGLASLVGHISGGHRQGTHSILGAVVFTAITGLLMWVGGLVAGLWCGFLFAVGFAALQLRFSKTSMVLHTLVSLAVGVVLVAITTSDLYVPLGLVTWSFGIGYVAHLLGDTLTREGVPYLLPLSRIRFHVADLTTGRFFEKHVLSPVLSLVVVGEMSWLFTRSADPTAFLDSALFAARTAFTNLLA